MYAELRMEFSSNVINYQQSSNLQGVIMETIDTDYAAYLHGNQTNPYSQYVTRENNKTIWHIQTLTDEAYQKIISPLSELKEITIRKKGITEPILSKKAINEQVRDFA